MAKVMNAQEYAASLRTDGLRLNEIAAEADLAVRVPTCGEWNLEALITHCAQVWTFVARSVQAGGPADRASISAEGRSLADWHRRAHAELAEVLSDGAPDDPCWSFDPSDQTLGFWLRRAAQEAAMHRWDAEHALGAETPIPAELAVDGIDEVFDFFVPVRQPAVFAGDGETLHLHATDAAGEWLVTRTPDGITVERAHRKGDVAARGTASDLLLFVWGRRQPAALEVFGDAELLSAWQREVRF